MKEKKAMTLLIFSMLILLILTDSLYLASTIRITLFALSLALICDFFKGYLPLYYKPSLLAAAFILATAIYVSNPAPSIAMGIFYLLPIGLTMIFYGTVYGGGMFVVVMGFLFLLNHLIFGNIAYFPEQLVMIGFSTVGFGYLSLQNNYSSITNEGWLEKLHIKINELSLLREITNTMQRTTDLKKLHKIILTALTAGYGLGFNRAAIFLVKDNKLQGVSGVGPLTKAEAYKTWGRLVSNQSSLHEIIEIDEEVDETLSDVIKKVEIDLDNNPKNPLVECIKKKAPMKCTGSDPSLQGEPLTMLNFENFAMAPLISQNQAVGILLVDNRFNENEITDEDLDSLVAFSNQSALAIENIRLYDQVSSLAITDGLTTVYNHRHFKRTLNREITNKRPFSLMVIDIDDFKQFNEKYGHTYGDQVLSEVGKTLKQVIATHGTVYRYGGDEFTVILPRQSKAEAMNLAKKIQGEIETRSTQMGYEVLTISIGLSKYPEEGVTESDLFIMADQKLQCSKKAGKNTVS